MSIEVWKFIVKQADILKNKRLAEMKALAENDATEEISNGLRGQSPLTTNQPGIYT